MTGRRLYEHFCDATSEAFPSVRGGFRKSEAPLSAWPSLTDRERTRWDKLAKRVSPRKPKPKPTVIHLVGISEKKIQGIKEVRAFTGWSLLDSKLAADAVQTGYTKKLELPKGVTMKDAERALSEWTVVG